MLAQPEVFAVCNSSFNILDGSYLSRINNVVNNHLYGSFIDSRNEDDLRYDEAHAQVDMDKCAHVPQFPVERKTCQYIFN